MADETKRKMFVQARTEQGFRRIGRWFGPEMTEVDVTDDEARALLSAPTMLLVLTEKAKAEMDQITGATPAPAPAPRVEAKTADAPKKG